MIFIIMILFFFLLFIIIFIAVNFKLVLGSI